MQFLSPQENLLSSRAALYVHVRQVAKYSRLSATYEAKKNKYIVDANVYSGYLYSIIGCAIMIYATLCKDYSSQMAKGRR